MSRHLIPQDKFLLHDITSDYIDEWEGQRVKNLFKLELNGKCFFDDFLDMNPKKVGNKKKIIEELDAYLTLLIEGAELPPSKIKPIGSNEFEIRIKRTRIYLFIDPPNDHIVVLGHYNKRDDDQQDYIDKFRNIKVRYLKTK